MGSWTNLKPGQFVLVEWEDATAVDEEVPMGDYAICLTPGWVQPTSDEKALVLAREFSPKAPEEGAYRFFFRIPRAMIRQVHKLSKRKVTL